MEPHEHVPIDLPGVGGKPAVRLLQTFVYYDRPLLFLADWANHGNYIFGMTDDSPEGEKWVASPVSGDELIGLGSGEIDFRSAFVGDGRKIAAQITIATAGAPDIAWVESGTILDADLPEVGTRLPGPWLEESTFSRPSDARAIVRVIGPHERVDHPHPKVLGELVSEFVWLLELGAAAAAGHPVGRRGKVPRHVTDGLPLSVAGFAKGSFGIVLDSESPNEPVVSRDRCNDGGERLGWRSPV